MSLNPLDWRCSSLITSGYVASIGSPFLTLPRHSMSPFRIDLSTLIPASSAPLLSNIMPHLQTLVNFVTNTLPKPVLVALVYRLTILLGAARVLPSIGVDSWEADYGIDDGWDGRPVSSELSD
jgi:hypothetical protein